DPTQQVSDKDNEKIHEHQVGNACNRDYSAKYTHFSVRAEGLPFPSLDTIVLRIVCIMMLRTKGLLLLTGSVGF
ncbi:MAG: hypothetical protein IKF42_10410, partial [Mogibacterium sp.]|nr:hypothetical protein [Mogibacterium sp.]